MELELGSTRCFLILEKNWLSLMAICDLVPLLIRLKTADPILGPTSHPSPVNPKTIKPSAMNGSSGTCATTLSATPLVKRIDAVPPAARADTTENASCHLRRVLRSLKKVFQSRGGCSGCAAAWAAAAASAAEASSSASLRGRGGRTAPEEAARRCWVWMRKRRRRGLIEGWGPPGLVVSRIWHCFGEEAVVVVVVVGLEKGCWREAAEVE